MKRVRQLCELTQTEFAQRLKVPVRTYKNYEMGLRELPISVAVKLCEQEQISPDWLLLGKGKMRHNPTVADVIAFLDVTIGKLQAQLQDLIDGFAPREPGGIGFSVRKAGFERALQNEEALRVRILELQEELLRINHQTSGD